MVVAEGLVGLEHGEFRRMRGVGAFVAEVAVDLEHVLDPADDGPLEEQLRRDAQVHVDVVGVHVGLERAGRGSSVHGLQHRGLDLDEVLLGEGPAQRGHHLGSRAHRLPCLFAGDEIEIALTDPSVLGQFGVQPGQGANRLRCQGPGVREHGQLSALGLDHPTVQEQEIAEVDIGLEVIEALLTDLAQREHPLQAGSVPGLQRHEAQFAGGADEDDAADDADDDVGLLPRLEPVMGGVDLGEGVGAGHRYGVGLGSVIEETLALFLPDPDLLGIEMLG